MAAAACAFLLWLVRPPWFLPDLLHSVHLGPVGVVTSGVIIPQELRRGSAICQTSGCSCILVSRFWNLGCSLSPLHSTAAMMHSMVPLRKVLESLPLLKAGRLVVALLPLPRLVPLLHLHGRVLLGGLLDAVKVVLELALPGGGAGVARRLLLAPLAGAAPADVGAAPVDGLLLALPPELNCSSDRLAQLPQPRGTHLWKEKDVTVVSPQYVMAFRTL